MNERYEKLAAAVNGLAAKFGTVGSYAIYVKDEPVLDTAYGFADSERKVPLTAKHRICSRLRARWIVGICFARLMDEKRVKTSDKLSKFIPEYPHAGEITLLQLLTACSGVPDHTTQVVRRRCDADPAFAKLDRAARYAAEAAVTALEPTAEELIADISPLPLDFAPGTQESYDNDSEMALLAEALVRVSGKSLYELACEYVFEPAGMWTAEGDCADTDTAGRLSEPNAPAIPIKHTPTRFAYTTDGESVLRLTRALAEGRLLSEKGWALMERHAEGERSAAFESNNGLLSFYSVGPFGYEVCGYFSRHTGVAVANTMCEKQSSLLKDGEAWYFRPRARREFEGALQDYTDPKLERVSKKNIWEAIELTVADEQLTYVDSAKMSLAYSSVDRTERPYVARDCGRAVGLLMLRINKKKNIYDVSILLVDRRFQGRGYGKFMLRHGIEMLLAEGATELSIGVNRANTVARSLYESMGFRAKEVYEGGVTLEMKPEDYIRG